jgi:5'-deoxynucleotidase YfbR-like HD superfamily hydrolase
VYEDEIRYDQLKDLPNSKELLKLSKEYQERKTLESKIAKDADLLDETFLLREYDWQGNKEAKDWLRGLKKQSHHEKMMYTKLARDLAKEAKKQPPSSWWKKLWTPNRRE